FIVSFLALCIGLLLLFFIIPAFNGFTGKAVHARALLSISSISTIVLILGFISPAGGIYPALYLSGFEPANILKGGQSDYKRKRILRRISLRQLLVVSQFTISGAVIICTLLVYDQLKMMKNKDLGFNK